MCKIKIDNNRIEELLDWMGPNEEIRHCHGCNYHYHEDNWVETTNEDDWVCKHCDESIKNSELLITLINRTEVN